MTEYSELVKALRLCQFGECGCGKCYYKELKGDWCTEDNHPEFFDCDDKLKLDAADAIEELQQIAAHYEQSAKDWWQEAREYKIKSAEGITAEESKELIKRFKSISCGLIEQLPKQGEWIEDATTYAGPGLSNYKCSLCGKICGTWRSGLEPSELPNWCGNCGAYMRKMEVQE